MGLSHDRRKTVTFSPEIFTAIQKYRAEALKNSTVNEDELTFTKAVNILCKKALENKK